MVVSALGLWLLAVWGNFRGYMPTWSLFLLAPTLLALVVIYGRWHLRRSRDEVEASDELTPWRGLRVIRSLQLRAESLETTTLILELASEANPTTTAATLRFEGISRLQVMQFGPYPIYFDGLRSERLPRTRSDGRTLLIRDVWNQMLQFCCVSFEELSRDHAMPVG